MAELPPMPLERDESDDESDGFGLITEESLAKWADAQRAFACQSSVAAMSVPTILPSEDSWSDVSDDAIKKFLMETGWSSSAGENDTETDVEDRTELRHDTDLDCVMLAPVICQPNIPWLVKDELPVPPPRENELRDNGLSPEPLYSFFHKRSKARHWSQTTLGVSFICNTVPSNLHARGGDPRFNLQGGVCKTCIDYVQSHEKVKWRAYFESQNFVPPCRRGKPGRSQLEPSA